MSRRLFIVSLFAGTLTAADKAVNAPVNKPVNKPIQERALLDALKIGGLKPHELVRKIKERGVAFVVTPPVEADLRRAGAAPEVIDAARANYRKP